MNVPFKRILAALDRVASADDVFTQAIALAQQSGGHLMLTHCLSLRMLEQLSVLIDAGVGLASSARLRQLQDEHLDEVNEVWRWLCRYALQAQTYGVFAEVSCGTGEARVQICDLAQQWNADLIMLGTGRKPSFKEKLFGSTTTHVVQYAPCSVIVVRSDSPEYVHQLATLRRVPEPQPLQQQSAWNFSLPIAYPT